MKIYYKNSTTTTDITSYISQDASVTISYRYGSYAILPSNSINTLMSIIKIGGEILVKSDDDNTIYFGGILKSIDIDYGDISSTSNRTAILTALGYEYVCYHRVLTSFNSEDTNYITRLTSIINTGLSGEGFTIGNIADYSYDISSGKEQVKTMNLILDEYALISGSRWFITPQKIINITNSLPVTESGIYINTANPITSVSSFTVKYDLDKYRNGQAMSGDEGAFLLASDSSEITSMANRFGSGKYQYSTFTSKILSTVGCATGATEILHSYNVSEASILEYDSQIGQNTLYARAWLKDINSSIYQPYVITKLTYIGKNNTTVHAYAERYNNSTIRP